MSGHSDDIKLKLAWQTAFERRTCPDSETLHVADPDESLKRHLAICHVCRDKREMANLERNAWKVMREKFATIAMKPGSGTDKQAGQVWTIKREFGGWREDGRFVRPPRVLLLEHVANTSGWQVVQLYEDKRLMGSGDVPLGDSFGFAEGWNRYSLKDDRFYNCLGVVQDDQLQQILATAVATHEPVSIGSTLSFFRKMEIEVGAYVALPAVVEMVDEFESALQPVTVTSWLENMFGSIAEVARGLRNYEVPSIADSIEDMFFCTSNPAPQLGAATIKKDKPQLVNIVRKQADGNIDINTITASISGDWQDGTYFIEGTLDDEFPVGLHLLAWLTYNDERIGECINQMTENSPYFDIRFKNVPEEACQLDNVKFLLVSP